MRAKRTHQSNRPAGEDAKMRERAVQALELRIAGNSYRAIAKVLNVSEKTAFYDVQTELGRLDAVLKEKAEKVRELEMRRLDTLQAALQPGIDSGDPRAIAVGVQVLARRAKLYGLDAPTEVSGPGGGPLVMKQIIHQHLKESDS